MSIDSNSTVSGLLHANLSGQHFVVVGENWPPWFSIHSSPGSNPTYSGIMYEVLLYLSVSLNFTYNIVRPPDAKWGTGDAEGNWNGMLGMIKRHEVDFALGPFGVIYEREQACDFSIPVYIDYYAAFVPASLHQDPWPIVKPFGWRVWIGLLLTAPVMVIVLATGDRVFYKKGGSRWMNHVGFTMRTLLFQPAGWIPKELNYHKVLCAGWFMGVFVLCQSYSGTLTSILTVPTLPVPINSVEDLVEQTSIKWIIETGSIVKQIGSSSKIGSTFRKLHDGGLKGPGTCYDNLDMTKTGETGQVCERISIQKILSDDFALTGKCHFYVGTADFLSVSFAMAFQEGSPYLPQFNRGLQIILEMGFIDRWKSALMPNATMCDSVDKIIVSHGSNHPKGLSMTQLFGSFTMLLIGLALAILTFSWEYNLRWHQNRMKTNPSVNAFNKI